MMYLAKALDSLRIGMSIDITAKVYGMVITVISRCSAEKAVFRSLEPYTPLPYSQHIDFSIPQSIDDTVIRCNDGVFRYLHTGAFRISLIDIDQLDLVIMAVCFDFFIQRRNSCDQFVAAVYGAQTGVVGITVGESIAAKYYMIIMRKSFYLPFTARQDKCRIMEDQAL